MKNILFFILIALFAGTFHSVSAIEYGSLGIFPNASEVSEKNPLTKAWFIYNLKPGEIKNGKVDIANTSGKAIEAKIYPVDAATTADGAFAPEPEDKEKTGVGSWISLNASELSLKSGETKTIDFTIRVPDSVEVGDHMGAIIVQSKALAENMEGSGMRIATRVGARMYVTIPGDTIEKLAFDKFIPENRDNNIVNFYASFSNKGNVKIRLKGIIEIKDSSGQTAGVADIPEREVFPNKSITIPVEWSWKNIKGGEFKANAVVEYGVGKKLAQETVFSVSIPLSDNLFALAAVSPLGVGIGIGFIIPVILAGLIYFARRKNKK